YPFDSSGVWVGDNLAGAAFTQTPGNNRRVIRSSTDRDIARRGLSFTLLYSRNIVRLLCSGHCGRGSGVSRHWTWDLFDLGRNFGSPDDRNQGNLDHKRPGALDRAYHEYHLFLAASQKDEKSKT